MAAPPTASHDPPSGIEVTRHAGIVSFFTGLSRVGGLVRDMVFAHLFGASHTTDAFLMAFTIPNAFRMLVAEGSLTVSFLPVFNETQRRRGPAAAREVMRQSLAIFPSLGAIVTALCIVFAEPLVRLLASGFETVPGKLELTVTLTRWMLPFLALVSFVALAMGALNAQKRFASSAAAPVVFNIVHITAMVTLSQLIDPPLLGVAWGVLIGGAAQVALQAMALKRAGLLLAPRWTAGPEIREILRLMIPGVLSLGVYQINILLLRHFASYLGQGAVTYVYNADRFLQLPLGLFGIAIATAALPAFSDAHADGDRTGLRRAFGEAFRLTNFISIPAAMGLAVLALPIMATVFQHGEYTHEMARETASVLVSLSLGLVAVSAARVTGKVFFAMRDFQTPVACGVVGIVATVTFAPPLAMNQGVAGLALSVSLAAWLQLAVQLFFLRRRVGRLGLKAVAIGATRDLLVGAPMTGIVAYLAHCHSWTAGFTGVNVLALLALVLLGIAAFGGGQIIVGSAELRLVATAFRQRIQHSDRRAMRHKGPTPPRGPRGLGR